MLALPIISILLLLLLLGCLGLMLARSYAQYCMQRRPSIRALFIGLRPKLFMTLGLGLFFFGLYAGSVLMIAHGLDGKLRMQLFELAYRHPLNFVYAGMVIFVLISLIILAVRRLIKRIYNAYFL